jgi:hypothetical protein
MRLKETILQGVLHKAAIQTLDIKAKTADCFAQ